MAAAYFLAGTFDVDVFEARSKIGGHCDSQVIDYKGQSVTVDLGAQFFHPDTHPIYVTLLEELGVYDPEHRRRRHAGGARQPVHLPGGRGRAHLFVVAPAIDATSFNPVRRLLATRAAGGSVQHVVGDQRRRLDPQPAPRDGVQGRRPISVDHGDERVFARRCAAGVGAIDPADVRAGISYDL